MKTINYEQALALNTDNTPSKKMIERVKQLSHLTGNGWYNRRNMHVFKMNNTFTCYELANGEVVNVSQFNFAQ